MIPDVLLQALSILAVVLFVIGSVLAHFLGSFDWYKNQTQGTQTVITMFLSSVLAILSFLVLSNAPASISGPLQQFIAAAIALVAAYLGQAVTHAAARQFKFAPKAAVRTKQIAA